MYRAPYLPSSKDKMGISCLNLQILKTKTEDQPWKKCNIPQYLDFGTKKAALL